MAVAVDVRGDEAIAWAANHGDAPLDAELHLPTTWGGHIVPVGTLAPGAARGAAVRLGDAVPDALSVGSLVIADRKSGEAYDVML